MPVLKPKVIYFKDGMSVRASQVYVDANFVVALSRPVHIWHMQAQALVAALQERGTKINLSSLAFNEAIYQLLRLAQKDQNEDATASLPPVQDDINPHYALVLNQLDEAVLSLPLLQLFEPPNPKLLRRALHSVVEYKLDPADAFHYEAARRLNCPLVTNDVQFQKIPDPNFTVVTFF